jgi:hypothetical protein
MILKLLRMEVIHTECGIARLIADKKPSMKICSVFFYFVVSVRFSVSFIIDVANGFTYGIIYVQEITCMEGGLNGKRENS